MEPAATELVCGKGHGSLLVQEAATGAPDEWVTLDPSWRLLFR